MNKRIVVVLALLAVVLGAAALYMRRQEEHARPAPAALLGQRLFKNLDADAIARIVIRAPGATLTLQKKDGAWVLRERKDFPADLAKIKDLVLQAIELRIGQVVPLAGDDRAGLGLLAPGAGKPDATATALDFDSADGKRLAELLVGKKYFKSDAAADRSRAQADGRFVMLPDDAQRAYIVSAPLRQASAASADWISRDGFAIEQIKGIDVKYAAGGGYDIERANADAAWKFVGAKGGAGVDSSKANSAAFDLGGITVDDVAAQENAADFDHATLVTATTFDGLTYTLRLGKLEGERYPLRVAIDGQLARQFAPRKDEKPDALAARKKTFNDELARAQQRVARERALKDYVLLVDKSKFADLLKQKNDLVAQPAKKKP